MNVKKVLKKGMALAMTAFTAFSLVTMTGLSVYAQGPEAPENTAAPPDTTNNMIQSDLVFEPTHRTFIKHIKFNYKFVDKQGVSLTTASSEFSDALINQTDVITENTILTDDIKNKLLELPEGEHIFTVTQEMDSDSSNSNAAQEAALIDASQAKYTLNIYISSAMTNSTDANGVTTAVRKKEIGHMFIVQIQRDDGTAVTDTDQNKKDLMHFNNTVKQQLSSIIISTNTIQTVNGKDIADSTIKWAYSVVVHTPDSDTPVTFKIDNRDALMRLDATDDTEFPDGNITVGDHRPTTPDRPGTWKILFGIRFSEADSPLTFTGLPTGSTISIAQSDASDGYDHTGIATTTDPITGEKHVLDEVSSKDSLSQSLEFKKFLYVDSTPLEIVLNNISTEDVPTGVFSNTLPFIIIGIVACAGIIGYIVIKKKMKKQA